LLFIIAGLVLLVPRVRRNGRINEEILQLAKDQVELQRQTNELLRDIQTSFDSRDGKG
jgi:hypothetical protein